MPATKTPKFAPVLCFGLLAACAATEPDPATDPASPQDQFWSALSSHCGKAYAGRLVSNDDVDADFATAEMRMHVSECSDARIAIPFHVATDSGWDRSRTWLITRNDAGGLRLKHDHRHEDGEPDSVTMYGGDTAEEGTGRAQSFPVDEESVALFQREDLSASITNTWSIEVDPAGADNGKFAYQLRRTSEDGAPEDRNFRVEFDLSNAVEAPPPAWGWE
ncbi:MAG: hypothetical protein QNJ15_02135 [Erythrobacter sp.]|nr:hypothetical protein [Erythrobacter sp.]